jgi:putative oxygen-independent coproporphyrinogen III oxidase
MNQTVSIPISSIGGLTANHHQANSTVNLTALPPLSLYIHWPWCVRKCPYCDFNSHEYGASLQSNTVDEHTEAAYVQALLRDLEYELPHIWGRRVYSVFIGGGTPSLMRPQALDTLLAGIRARLPLEADAEITLEANPGTVEASRLLDFAATGINRISIGVQTFNHQHLQAIGRIHNGDQARHAVEMAVKAVSRVNVDLMYGLPNQTLAEAESDITQALQLGVGHLSAYHLTLEPNTYFSRYPPRLPDEDSCADMQIAVDEQLKAAGFIHYETSAYAQLNQRCQHNQNYWSFGDYVGIGAGAHGKISFPNRIVRTVKYKHPKAYLEANIIPLDVLAVNHPFMQSEQAVSIQELPFEFMLNTLRLQEGFDLAWFTERTGQPLMRIQKNLSQLQEKGLLNITTHSNNGAKNYLPMWLCPTTLGNRFLNDVIESFL